MSKIIKHTHNRILEVSDDAQQIMGMFNNFTHISSSFLAIRKKNLN